MISRCTSSVSKGDVVFPRLLDCDSRCSQTCRQQSQVLPSLLSVLPCLSLALPVTLKAGRNTLLGSDTLLKLTHLSLHSTSSQTLLEASSDKNTFCWCGASVQRMNLEFMSILTSNTHCGITTYIECLVMPTPRQPMCNSGRTMFTQDSTCMDIFPVSWVTSRSLSSSIQCTSASLTSSRCGCSTSLRCKNRSTSTMKSGYLCPLTMTSHIKISHMRNFFNGMVTR